jgi:hypothetical protein
MDLDDEAIGAGATPRGERRISCVARGGWIENHRQIVGSSTRVRRRIAVLRVAVSKVRMPRLHKITLGLPWATMYFADIRSSLIVELIPASAGRAAAAIAISAARSFAYS